MLDLDMLNRLRINAGMSELKSWKASKGLLKERIEALQSKGWIDALPGANINATPKADDPKLLEPFKEPEEAEEDPAEASKQNEPKVNHVKTQLARGIETDGYARHSRKAVQDVRRDERNAAKKKVKLSKSEKRALKEEAESRRPKGEVDAKKEPEKAARQQKHIADKKAKREKEGKKPKADKSPDEITIAEIARALDVDPRVARAKMRRHEKKVDHLHTKGQDRWTFPKSAKKEIEKILKGEK